MLVKRIRTYKLSAFFDTKTITNNDIISIDTNIVSTISECCTEIVTREGIMMKNTEKITMNEAVNL